MQDNEDLVEKSPEKASASDDSPEAKRRKLIRRVLTQAHLQYFY